MNFVEERRATEVLLAELAVVEWVERLERRLEHWSTDGSW